MTPRALGLVLAASMCTPSVLLTQPASAAAVKGVILGVVTDTSLRPIGAAEISIVLSSLRVTTGANGRFQIRELSAGNYLLAVRRLGYRPAVTGFFVGPGDTVRLALMLEPSSTELSPVLVSGKSTGSREKEFEERRSRSGGEFFTREEIERRGVVSAVDILRQAKALKVVPIGASLVAHSARQRTSCQMQVYLDGIPLAGVGVPGTPFDLNLLPSPREIMGMEVYAGTASVPIWLPQGPQNGKQACGAILVWTRDGF